MLDAVCYFFIPMIEFLCFITRILPFKKRTFTVTKTDLVLALMVICYHAVKVAMMNPVKA